MKRLTLTAAAITGLFLLGSVSAVQAEMSTIYGPVYVTKAKHEDHRDGHREGLSDANREVRLDGHKKKGTKITFTAPVPGAGVIVIKNGGDAGKKGRAASAEVEFNGDELLDERNFNKNVDEMRLNVQLQAENELEVELKSCRKCELEITVLGEKYPTPPPRPMLPPSRMPAPM